MNKDKIALSNDQYNYGYSKLMESKAKGIPMEIDAKTETFVNLILEAKGLDTLDKQQKIATEDLETLKKDLSKSNEKINALTEESEKLKKERDEATSKLAASSVQKLELPKVKVKTDGKIPNGNLTWVEAHKVFPIDTKYTFKVPVWEWDAPHPDVPEKDPNYIFREDLVIPVLYSLVYNKKMWLQGETGTGKTTLIEQVAAHCNYPFVCINFDSEISRYDLLGKMDLVESNGASVTKWIDGVIPRIMSGPYIGCFDELDFVRPDVAYVMQRVLEGNSLRLLEDGDREVVPDPMYRMFATGNTVGQGDEHGRYHGARPQSAAFLNRFTSWVQVPHLDNEQRKKLLENTVKGITPTLVEAVDKFTELHLGAFYAADVVQPSSPRTYIGIGEKAVFYMAMGNDEVASFKYSVRDTVLNACNSTDKGILAEFVERVL